MKYFKKIIKKWKLIKKLEQELEYTRVAWFGAMFSKYSSFTPDFRKEYFAIEKALNKLHKL